MTAADTPKLPTYLLPLANFDVCLSDIAPAVLALSVPR